MPRNVMTEERIIMILHAAESSTSIGEIAEMVSISAATINRWLWQGRIDLKAGDHTPQSVFTNAFEERRRRVDVRMVAVESAVQKLDELDERLKNQSPAEKALGIRRGHSLT